jgi:hypothetical protein
VEYQDLQGSPLCFVIGYDRQRRLALIIER